jgi:CheY-like chemotaxis protein
MTVSQQITSKISNINLEIVTVDSGKKAVEILKNSPDKFHLILSDIHMPEMDGFQLIHEIKKIAGDDIAIFSTRFRNLNLTFLSDVWY